MCALLVHRGTNPDDLRIGMATRYLDHAPDLHENDRDIVLSAIAEWSNEAF